MNAICRLSASCKSHNESLKGIEDSEGSNSFALLLKQYQFKANFVYHLWVLSQDSYLMWWWCIQNGFACEGSIRSKNLFLPFKRYGRTVLEVANRKDLVCSKLFSISIVVYYGSISGWWRTKSTQRILNFALKIDRKGAGNDILMNNHSFEFAAPLEEALFTRVRFLSKEMFPDPTSSLMSYSSKVLS